MQTLVCTGHKYQRVMRETSPIANCVPWSMLLRVHNTRYAVRLADKKMFKNDNFVQKTVGI